MLPTPCEDASTKKIQCKTGTITNYLDIPDDDRRKVYVNYLGLQDVIKTWGLLLPKSAARCFQLQLTDRLLSFALQKLVRVYNRRCMILRSTASTRSS